MPASVTEIAHDVRPSYKRYFSINRSLGWCFILASTSRAAFIDDKWTPKRAFDAPKVLFSSKHQKLKFLAGWGVKSVRGHAIFLYWVVLAYILATNNIKVPFSNQR